MPVKRGHDKKGKFYRYGKTGKKYYFKTEAQRKRAKQKAMIQAYAIEMNRKYVY